MADPTIVNARRLYVILVDACEGNALAIIRGCEPGNGYMAWNKLKREYEGRIAGRYQGMLTALMSPLWEAKVASGSDFSDLLLEWEQQVAIYELQRRRQHDDDVNVAVVTRYSPPYVRAALRQSAHVYGDDYRAMRRVLDQYLKAGREYDVQGVPDHAGVGSSSDAVPMDVGAVPHKGKGKDSFKINGKGFGKHTKGKNNCDNWTYWDAGYIKSSHGKSKGKRRSQGQGLEQWWQSR